MKINLLYTRQSKFEVQNWILNWKDSVILLWHGLWCWGLEEVGNACTNNLLRRGPAGMGKDGNQHSHQTSADSTHLWNLHQWPCWHWATFQVTSHNYSICSSGKGLWGWGKRGVQRQPPGATWVHKNESVSLLSYPEKFMHNPSPQLSLLLLPPTPFTGILAEMQTLHLLLNMPFWIMLKRTILLLFACPPLCSLNSYQKPLSSPYVLVPTQFVYILSRPWVWRDES